MRPSPPLPCPPEWRVTWLQSSSRLFADAYPTRAPRFWKAAPQPRRKGLGADGGGCDDALFRSKTDHLSPDLNRALQDKSPRTAAANDTPPTFSMPRVLITTVPFADRDRRPIELLESANIEYLVNPLGRKLQEQDLMLT